jgi:hypothetical protein
VRQDGAEQPDDGGRKHDLGETGGNDEVVEHLTDY